MPFLDNGSWVPIMLSDLEGTDNASWQAYLNFMWNCDRLATVKDPVMFIEHICMFSALIFTSLVGFAALPTTWRFSRRQSAGSGYLILFHTGITELYLQFRLLMLPYVEFFNGHVWRLPFPFIFMDSFLLQIAIARDWLVTALAFNRSMAVLYPLQYKKLFGRPRTTKLFILFAYSLMATEAIIMDWRPWYWKFDCTYLRAKSELPLGDFAGVTMDEVTRIYMEYFYPIKGYVHLCIYGITIAKLVAANLWGRIKSATNSGHINGHQQSQGHRTRIKLFIICFLMVLPNVGYIFLFQLVTRIFPWHQMDQATLNLVDILYKPFDLGTWAGQPFLLISLSKQFRQAVLADLRKWKEWILRKLISALMALTSQSGHNVVSVAPLGAMTGANTTNQQMATVTT